MLSHNRDVLTTDAAELTGVCVCVCVRTVESHVLPVLDGGGRPLVLRPAPCLVRAGRRRVLAGGGRSDWACETGMDVVTLLADRLQLHDAMRAPEQRLTDDANEVLYSRSTELLPTNQLRYQLPPHPYFIDPTIKPSWNAHSARKFGSKSGDTVNTRNTR